MVLADTFVSNNITARRIDGPDRLDWLLTLGAVVGNGIVTEQQLYRLIRQPKAIVAHQFEIEFLEPGLEAFVFTFA